MYIQFTGHDDLYIHAPVRFPLTQKTIYNEQPPPTKVADNTLPDFYLNTLIFEDTLSQDTCRWIVYDGLTRNRFPSRKDAIAWIENHKTSLPVPKSRLERCANRVDAAWRNLEFEAENLPDLEKSIIQKISLTLRQTNDCLLKFISDYAK